MLNYLARMKSNFSGMGPLMSGIILAGCTFGCGPSAMSTERAPVMSVDSVGGRVRDEENLHSYRVARVGKWNLEVWTYGTLYEPRTPIDIGGRITTVQESESVGDLPSTVTVSLRQADGTDVIREATRHIVLQKRLRHSLRVRTYDDGGHGKYGDLLSPNLGWELMGRNVFSVVGEDPETYLPLGAFRLDIEVIMEDSTRIRAKDMLIDVKQRGRPSADANVAS